MLFSKEKMKQTKWLLKILVRIKLYMARSMSYIAMVNSAMILFLLLSSLEKYGIDINITEYIIPIVIFTFLIMIAWGYFEDWIGMWEYEQTVSFDRNKYTKQILEKVESIDKRLKTIEEEK